MTNKFWKQANYLIGYIPYMAIFSVLVISANIEIRDLDIWLHLAAGKYISIHKAIPGVDMLSCSIAGKPWINHEWLFQVLAYQLFSRFGAQGLITMQVVVVCLTMLVLLFLGYRKDRQLFTAVMLFLLYMVFLQRFTNRPDLFSLFFFSIYIFVLSLHIDKRWSLPVLILVQIVWSNMHGFFFFGPLFVLIGIVSEFIKRHVKLPYDWNTAGRLTDGEYKRIMLIFVGTVAACCVNPMFIKGAWYPVSVFFTFSGENKIFFQHIQELQHPVAWSTLFDIDQYRYYKILIFLSLVSFVFNRRRIDISALIFWAVFLVFSLSAIRNTSFFAFAAYLVIITNTINLNYKDILPIRFSDDKFKYLTLIILNLLFVIWLIGYYQRISVRSYYDFDDYAFKSIYGDISKNHFPHKAADFLVANNVQGNFFNDFNSGAYLLGRTYPNIKVYIDGRTEVYGGAFFKNYREIWEKGNTELLEKDIAQYGLTGAFLNGSMHHIPKKALNYFYRSKDWALVYFDYDAAIFLKDIAQNRPVINKYRIDLATRPTPVWDAHRIGPLRVQPRQSYYRAFALESLGFYDKALEELYETIRIDPFYAKAHDLIGKIKALQGRHGEAFDHFRVAVAINPSDKDMRYNLALSYYDQEDFDGAVKQYEIIVRQFPKDPKGYYWLANARIKLGDPDGGFSALKQAYSLNPQSTEDLFKIGDLFALNKETRRALDSYRMAADAGQDAGEAYKKMGRLLLQNGDRPSAKAILQKALVIVPDDREVRVLLQGL